MKKIIINTFILIILFFLLDFLIYCYENYVCDWKSNYGYVFKNPYIYLTNINDYNKEIYITSSNKKNQSPILIFGCSYARGFRLKDNQKFAYKLNKLLNRNIYNRAINASTYSFMYWQTTQDEFYKQVPPSKDVIYIFMFDHFRRNYIYTFNPVLNEFYIHYSIKDNELIFDKYENPFKNFIMSLYIVKLIYGKYVKYFVESYKNYNTVTDDALLYFIKSRENLEKHWKNELGKINFTVILYDTAWEPPFYNFYKEALRKKLKEKGFNVISTDELTNEDLTQPKYLMHNNWHPAEAAWDLLTPLIAKKITTNDNKIKP